MKTNGLYLLVLVIGFCPALAEARGDREANERRIASMWYVPTAPTEPLSCASVRLVLPVGQTLDCVEEEV